MFGFGGFVSLQGRFPALPRLPWLPKPSVLKARLRAAVLGNQDYDDESDPLLLEDRDSDL